MDRETLLSNIEFYRERIAEASQKWGDTQICAVTKTIGTDVINMAYDGGIRVIGENRVQELMEKKDALDPRYEVQIIGSLQTNKVKYIIECVDMIQSVDRIALAEEISRRAAAKERVMPVLIQVNIAEEVQKGGVWLQDLDELLKRCAELPGIQVKGLMSIMPFAEDPEAVRPYFRRMRNLFDDLRDRNMANISMDVLSMGMSGDCIVAAQEGATMVRLGRALFGARVYK